MLGQSENAGGYNAPGLPDITGYLPIGHARLDTSPPYGAISLDIIKTENYGETNPGGKSATIRFSASRSNSIYGAASTVMPPSVNIPVILYLGRPK